MKIIFGTRKLGKEDGATGAFQKYDDKAVITLEGDRGHGKSRRFLFNALAMEALGLEKGSVQQLVFGTLIDDENGVREVLLANANNIVQLEGLTLYKTSKNYVSYDDSKEKGKGVSSSVITGDIAEFLKLGDDQAHEFTIEHMPDIDGMDAYKLILISEAGSDELTEEVDEIVVGENFSETFDAEESVPEVAPQEVAPVDESNEEFANVDVEADPFINESLQRK